MNSQKSIIISGGAGFLGSHLSDLFLAKGWRVLAVDNLSTGSKNNVAHLKNNKNFRFIEHDICDELPKSILGDSFDVVANLASPASPPHYQRLALQTLMVGSNGVKQMLDLALKNRARFFQTSTSEVYGDPEVHPQPETYKGSVNCYGPRSMYDESKRFAEALIWVYRNNYKVDTAIVRIFNTYGPRMDANDGRVVSNFIVQALKGQSLTIYGDGSQTRSFCYVDDLIRGFYKIIESDIEGPINLGNPGEFTMLELANIVLRLTDSKSKLIFMPLPGDDPTQRKPIIEQAKQLLDWSPTVNLEEGLGRTIKYFEKLVI